VDSLGETSSCIERLIAAQTIEAQSHHPALEAVRLESGQIVVRGPVGFAIRTSLGWVEDDYELRLEIPEDYPSRPPVVFETGGRIDEAFDHFMAAGNFCLGAPVEVRSRFAVHGNLLRFIEEQVVPFLFSYTYKREHQHLPFGELAHGAEGLLQYYCAFFEASEIEAFQLLLSLANGASSALGPCPCGKGRPAERCHGPKLRQLRPHLTRAEFRHEVVGLMCLLGARKH